MQAFWQSGSLVACGEPIELTLAPKLTHFMHLVPGVGPAHFALAALDGSPAFVRAAAFRARGAARAVEVLVVAVWGTLAAACTVALVTWQAAAEALWEKERWRDSQGVLSQAVAAVAAGGVCDGDVGCSSHTCTG